MITRLVITTAVLTGVTLSVGPLYGAQEPGAVYGVTLRPDGIPLPKARVMVHCNSDNSDRAVVSGSDGAFVIVNLKPGSYQLIASKDGFLTSSATVQVKASDNLSVALALSSTETAAAASGEHTIMNTASAQAKVLEAMQQRIEHLEAMQARIEQLEAELKHEKSEAAPGLPLYASLTAPPVAVPVTTPAPVALAMPTAPQAAAAPAVAQAAPATPAVDNVTPFADYDWTWLNGSPRNKDVAFDSKFFTPEIRADVTYTFDFNRPQDDSMGGSSELFRSNEVQLEQLGIGGDFHWDNVRGRFMTQFGA